MIDAVILRQNLCRRKWWLRGQRRRTKIASSRALDFKLSITRQAVILIRSFDTLSLMDYSPRSKRVILEYVGSKEDERIYGFGYLLENGEVQADEEETFGSPPREECDVSKADGKLVSYADYCAELDAQSS